MPESDETVRQRAPAKLNLALAVGAAAPGGLHPVCTWMVTVDLHDDLTVTRLGPDRLSRYAILWHPEARRRSDVDWSVAHDLAVRAQLALERRAGRRLPVQMKLEKRIPVGGGRGGGSSDAAAMLRALNELFVLRLAADELREVAAEVGSDVPFFVTGGSALVEGFGERVEPHPTVPELHAVIVFPAARCPTSRVYAHYDEAPGPLRDDRVRRLVRAGGAAGPVPVFNDLSAAAIRAAPELAGHLERLGALAERPAHVAGSGSSLFVLCDEALHAEALASTVEKSLELPAVAVRTVGPTLPSGP